MNKFLEHSEIEKGGMYLILVCMQIYVQFNSLVMIIRYGMSAIRNLCNEICLRALILPFAITQHK